jgi:hypothetical protein
LPVLCLDEFDSLGRDLKALGKEPPLARTGYDVVLPMARAQR